MSKSGLNHKSLHIFAPAKINLFLHITGRLSNNYHLLDSLVAFADIGDTITIEPQDYFDFTITGSFKKDFNSVKNNYSDNDNLVVKAAIALANVAEKPLNFKITLEKNLPIAAGIGGGSSDAAATLWGLCHLWDIDVHANYIKPLMKNIGADVPVCMSATPSIMRGIGDDIMPSPELPEIPILLINPLIPCPTPDVFLNYSGNFKSNVVYPQDFATHYELCEFLSKTENDLFQPALKILPEIQNIINALKHSKGCLLSRMSGSGATCFGLFENENDALAAKKIISEENPDWWIRAGWLNRIERY